MSVKRLSFQLFCGKCPANHKVSQANMGRDEKRRKEEVHCVTAWRIFSCYCRASMLKGFRARVLPCASTHANYDISHEKTKVQISCMNTLLHTAEALWCRSIFVRKCPANHNAFDAKNARPREKNRDPLHGALARVTTRRDARSTCVPVYLYGELF